MSCWLDQAPSEFLLQFVSAALRLAAKATMLVMLCFASPSLVAAANMLHKLYRAGGVEALLECARRHLAVCGGECCQSGHVRGPRTKGSRLNSRRYDPKGSAMQTHHQAGHSVAQHPAFSWLLFYMHVCYTAQLLGLHQHSRTVRQESLQRRRKTWPVHEINGSRMP